MIQCYDMGNSPRWGPPDGHGRLGTRPKTNVFGPPARRASVRTKVDTGGHASVLRREQLAYWILKPNHTQATGIHGAGVFFGGDHIKITIAIKISQGQGVVLDSFSGVIVAA